MSRIAPLCASVPAAVPVAMLTLPDDPELVVPVENDIVPLTPRVPPLAVRSTTAPLDFTVPNPDDIDTDPPVTAELVPAVMIIWPPAAALSPTVNEMKPDGPLVPLPDDTEMPPELPL